MATSVVNNAQTNAVPAKFRHIYHADATLFDIELKKPVDHSEKHAQISLRGPDNRYDRQDMGPYKLRGGLISYAAGYTHVAARETDKAYTTLTTGAIENLNVLDVLTADRVVGQIYTEHLKPKNRKDPNGPDPVPIVTFIGTRFDNLRICGQKIDVDLESEILGARREKDGSYLNAEKLLAYVQPPGKKLVPMPGGPPTGNGLKTKRQDARTGGSLVKRISEPPVGEKESEYCIFIPHFGKIYLGELEIIRVPSENKREHDAYHIKLNMIRLAMGCIASGKGTVVGLDANGGGSQGGGGKG